MIAALALGACLLGMDPGAPLARSDERAPSAASEAEAAARARAEFDARLATLSVKRLDEAIALASWAADRGLLDRADALYRAILREDPTHEVAYHALKFLSESRPLAKESDAYALARAAVPERFEEYETRRYVILSDADPRWVRTQCQRLERACSRFARFATELELRALPLRHKLVAVVFDHRADFLAFARTDGNAASARLAGYYSLADDRLVFYHVESNENIMDARADLEALHAEAEAIRRRSRRARSTGDRTEANEMRRDLERRLSHLDERERRINFFAYQRSVSVTIHEAIHQLMFHTGVQSPYVEHPMWLTEGLATAFETDTPEAPFGPSREYAPRREAFWSLLDEDRLVPLESLLTMKSGRVMQTAQLSDAMYHQGYALVSWMARHRRLELRRYLEALNALPPGRPSPDVHAALFAEHFGDVDALEESWLRHERGR
jgi:hypothetical protein